MKQKTELILFFALNIFIMALFLKFFVMPMGQGNVYKQVSDHIVKTGNLYK